MTSCTKPCCSGYYAQGIKYKIFNDTNDTKIFATASAINASAKTCGTSGDATYCNYDSNDVDSGGDEIVIYVVDDCTCIASGDNTYKDNTEIGEGTYKKVNNCIEVGNNGQYKIQVTQESCWGAIASNCTLDCVKDATMTWQYGSCTDSTCDSGVSAGNSCQSDSDCPIGIIDKTIKVKGAIDAMTC